LTGLTRCADITGLEVDRDHVVQRPGGLARVDEDFAQCLIPGVLRGVYFQIGLKPEGDL
jgi:hypothetical protein